MRGVEGKEGKRRFGFSYVLLVVAILTYVCAWGYSVFAADSKAKAEVPQIDPILAIIKGLRQYQQIKASFPQTFEEVEKEVWKHANRPSYGSGGNALVLKHYYYLYTLISPTRCTLWALPIGPHACEANSYFLILTPTDREKFKGPALNLQEASGVNGVPTYTQLAILGLIKQDPIPEKRK